MRDHVPGTAPAIDWSTESAMGRAGDVDQYLARKRALDSRNIEVDSRNMKVDAE